MKERLEQIKAEAVARIQEADVPEKLNDVRVKFLGKKGELTASAAMDAMNAAVIWAIRSY